GRGLRQGRRFCSFWRPTHWRQRLPYRTGAPGRGASAETRGGGNAHPRTARLALRSRPMIEITLSHDPARARHGSNAGQPLTRLDGPLKVTGRAAYAADQRPEGLLHAALEIG